MNTDQDTLDIIELGVASNVTQGSGLAVIESIGYLQRAGISDAD